MIERVASRLGLPSRLLAGRDQEPHLTLPRRVYWAVLRDTYVYSAQELARIVDRSVSNVYYGLKYIDDALDMDDPEVVRLWDKVKDLPDVVALEALHPRCEVVMMLDK